MLEFVKVLGLFTLTALAGMAIIMLQPARPV